MNKKKKSIQIYMIHPFTYSVNSMVSYLRILDYKKKTYEFIWNVDSPDYLIVSEHIYYYKKSWDEFVRLYEKAKVVIFFAGECICPDLNIFDYAIGFEKNMSYLDRVIRLPIRLFFDNWIPVKVNNLAYDREASLKELRDKNRFCSFIYSNGEGHIKRKELFDVLSKYKKVDSYGRFLNNNSFESKAEGSVEIALEGIALKRHHKFSISCENASSVGYTSEKIYTSLIAHSIPIYWGNPLIEQDVNPKTFINCNNLSDDEIVRRIKEIDENDELWADMISEPWLTDEQLKQEKDHNRLYQQFIDHIFEQSSIEARRRSEGYHPSRYKVWFWEY